MDKLARYRQLVQDILLEYFHPPLMRKLTDYAVG